MKLYTEEQVKELFKQFQSHLPFHYELLLQEHMNKTTPIELPSDEDITNKALEVGYTKTLFSDGAKWMRDKIQGGSK